MQSDVPKNLDSGDLLPVPHSGSATLGNSETKGVEQHDLEELIEDLTVFCASLLGRFGSIEDAEDMVGDAIAILIARHQTLEWKFARPSLYETVKYLSSNWKRKHGNQAQKHIRLDDCTKGGQLELHAEQPTPDSLATAKSDIDCVLMRVAEGCKLEPKCSATCVPLVLRAQDKKLHEIGAILKLPDSTVSDHLQRCISRAASIYQFDKTAHTRPND